MNNTNGFVSSLASMSNREINDTAKSHLDIQDNIVTRRTQRIKSKTTTSTKTNEVQSIKQFSKQQKPIDLESNERFQGDSNNNDKNLTKSASSGKMNGPVPYCNSCGECSGDMISCRTCSATFHVRCVNPLSKQEDLSSVSYSCENCRTITKEDLIGQKQKQQKPIRAFMFKPKRHLISTHPKVIHAASTKSIAAVSTIQSTVEQTNQAKPFSLNYKENDEKTNTPLLLSSSTRKRKRTESSSSSDSSVTSDAEIPRQHLNTLNCLFASSPTEHFVGPLPKSHDSNYNQYQKHCFICQKSLFSRGPSIQCDSCPLAYHTNCLIPSMTSLPPANEKWSCPNHAEPILYRQKSTATRSCTNQRVKLYHRNSMVDKSIVLQQFMDEKQTKDDLLLKTNNHRLERIVISQIPKDVAEYYYKASSNRKAVYQIEVNDVKEDSQRSSYSTDPLSVQSSQVYDPCVWDILQAILSHICDNDAYEFSCVEQFYLQNRNVAPNSSNDVLDELLELLSEPNSTSNQQRTNKNNTQNLLHPFDSEDSYTKKQISKLLTNKYSTTIDLSQFRLSHAAFIHLHSKTVIYIKKNVIWFGSSSQNDICLNDYKHDQNCPHISERHACLYYDRKHNLFELLNYSEYGTIVNDLRYGLNATMGNRGYHRQANESLSKCQCLTGSHDDSCWDGPALIEKGTVVKIGCHEFLFYRHTVR